MSYLIKLDDACTVFSLYRDGEFMGAKGWVGQHLLDIGREHGIDLSRCTSESQMLSILEQHVTIEVSDE